VVDGGDSAFEKALGGADIVADVTGSRAFERFTAQQLSKLLADPAIAANAVLCVVYPHMAGLGGDGFWLIHHPNERQVRAINASGPAAQAATQKLVSEAEERAASAEQRANKATTQAEQTRREAEQHAKQVQASAKKSADQIVAEAKSKAEHMISDAKAERDREVSAKEQEVEKLHKQKESIEAAVAQLQQAMSNFGMGNQIPQVAEAQAQAQAIEAGAAAGGGNGQAQPQQQDEAPTQQQASAPQQSKAKSKKASSEDDEDWWQE
jgi:hypothetical protein